MSLWCFSPLFYWTFWSMSMYDLRVPTGAYEKQIQQMYAQIQQTEDSKEMVSPYFQAGYFCLNSPGARRNRQYFLFLYCSLNNLEHTKLQCLMFCIAVWTATKHTKIQRLMFCIAVWTATEQEEEGAGTMPAADWKTQRWGEETDRACCSGYGTTQKGKRGLVPQRWVWHWVVFGFFILFDSGSLWGLHLVWQWESLGPSSCLTVGVFGAFVLFDSGSLWGLCLVWQWESLGS